MSTATTTSPAREQTQPRWRPLRPIDRRVVGVLVEKAKTTPDAYPLTLNAIKNGCNQKSNREPVMALDEDEVEGALERLREMRVVVELISDGRVPKFRHMMYEWLGVDKVELAVMTELLLRGPQTIGELRGRAARMEPIASLAELQPLLDSLHAKKLILYLTPRGRGCVVTHALYLPEELEQLKARYASAAPPREPDQTASASLPSPPAEVQSATDAPHVSQAEPLPSSPPARHDVELDRLRDELIACREEIAELRNAQQRLEDDVEDLKRQLGV